MKKKHSLLLGHRLFNRHSGRMGTITEVNPHGKTSVRFIIVCDGQDYRHEETEGELQRNWFLVPDDYAHSLPSAKDRLQRLIRVVDENLQGRIPFHPGNFTSVLNRVTDTKTGRIVEDEMMQGSPFGDRNWSLSVCLWGGEHFNIEATPEDMKASGGYTWPAFKPKLEAIIETIDKF